MGSLTMGTASPAVVTLNNIGVFIFGEGLGTTSDFLAAGSMQWQKGPALPLRLTYPCAVAITATSFLAIHETNIREFDSAIDGPTSTRGWREADAWPVLRTSRIHKPACAMFGQKVIIAGGGQSIGESLSSTEVLDLSTRRLTSGGEMATPRGWFHVGTIISGGQETMFAVGGYNRPTRLNTVEEWVEECSTWKAAYNLAERRSDPGAVVVSRQLVCPV